MAKQSVNYGPWLESLAEMMPNAFEEIQMQEVNQNEWEGQLVVKTQELERVAQFLRDHDSSQMEQLIEISAADYPERAQRFEVIYYLLSVRWNQRVTLKVRVGEIE